MDVILCTTKIRWTYPKDRQQPKAFRVRAGRSSGSYHYDITLQFSSNVPDDVFAFDPFMFLDGSVTGTYYVKISSVHYDDSQVHGDEFTINVIEPTDAVIAPVVYVA